MSKKPVKATPAALASSNPQLPKELAKSLEAARGQTLPVSDDDVLSRFPLLMQFLAPRPVSLPPASENASPREARSEPFLMISWDSQTGSWKWGITMKLLKYAMGGLLGMDPAKWMNEIEETIKAGKHNPREVIKRPKN